MKKLIFSFLTLLGMTYAFSQTKPAHDLVSKMTLEEKASLVVGMGINMPGMPGASATTPEKVPGAAGNTFAIPRLNLPGTVVADGPAGLRIDPKHKGDSIRTYYATAWPVATLIASTWNTPLAEQVGKSMGNEVKEYGVDVILGPGMNIHRNPLGGRNFEYYSEDPLVAGKMTAAVVKGVQSNGVGTSIKHFAANNEETNRNTINVIASERALREIYLKGFQIAIKESQPWTVMSSYNYVNGKYTSENYDLITTILRKEWGFKGMVMTDWFGGKDAVGQMKAGNDLLMPGTPAQKKAILDAVNSGALDIKILNENAERIVRYVLGSQAAKKYAYTNKPDLAAHATLARAAATEGMVLLKNENTLPIKSNSHIATFGNTSFSFIAGGTGSGDVNEAYTVSLVQGLSANGYHLDQEVNDIYTKYLDDYNKANPKKSFFMEFMNPTPSAPEYALSNDIILKKANETESALITIGRNAGEGKDRKTTNDYYLSDTELALIKNVSDAYHALGKKVTVIINTGGVIDVAAWRDKVDAILMTWQGGQESGNAVADILSGKANPSGKLATTFPMHYEDDATVKNFPGIEFPEKATNTGMFGMKAVPGEVTYEEGIYVGYRYYNTFNVKPAYEFGYGLSFSNFSYNNLKLSSNTFTDKITVNIDITNTGKMAGKEVVQLYVNAPTGKLQKPSEELKAFAKTNLLMPGQKQTIKLELTASDLASFDTESSAWIADAGKYEVRIGASSQMIKQTAYFTLSKSRVTEKCNKVLTPTVSINELKK